MEDPLPAVLSRKCFREPVCLLFLFDYRVSVPLLLLLLSLSSWYRAVESRSLYLLQNNEEEDHAGLLQ